jgi:Protein of unknown function (DUF3089)
MTIISSKKINSLVALSFTFLMLSCASKKPINAISTYQQPPAPNYADLKYWAAHPDKKDPADRTPVGTDLKDLQNESQVDVFFIHPTTLTYNRGNDVWNGDVNNEKLNQKTDDGAILFQASIFNNVGRVFAPRYRQAHLYSFFTQDTASARVAFAMAYSDIKAAFESFLKNHNQNRPIIIAAHSQGTLHAKWLLKEFFEGKPLQNRLIVAYIVGLPVEKNYFSTIPVCEKPEQTGCFCSWRTFLKGYEPKQYFPLGDNYAVVNPLSWNTDLGLVNESQHKGCVLLGFKPTKANLVDAQIHKGILWIKKPSFRGSFFYRTPNYHVGDYNLFYFNIQEDVKRRVGLFWKG